MKRTKRKNRRYWIFGILAFLALIIVLSVGKRGFLQQIRVYRAKRQLQREIERLEERKRALEEEKQKLDDPEYIEKIAREEYGMAKEKEKVYNVVPKEK